MRYLQDIVWYKHAQNWTGQDYFWSIIRGQIVFLRTVVNQNDAKCMANFDGTTPPSVTSENLKFT